MNSNSQASKLVVKLTNVFFLAILASLSFLNVYFYIRVCPSSRITIEDTGGGFLWQANIATSVWFLPLALAIAFVAECFVLRFPGKMRWRIVMHSGVAIFVLCLSAFTIYSVLLLDSYASYIYR